ncbi:MAG: hypothetical protein AAGC74_09530 [Verrucomicrobiota bacterium]
MRIGLILVGWLLLGCGREGPVLPESEESVRPWNDFQEGKDRGCWEALRGEQWIAERLMACQRRLGGKGAWVEAESLRLE